MPTKRSIKLYSVKRQNYEAQRQGYTEGEIVSSIIRSMQSGLTLL